VDVNTSTTDKASELAPSLPATWDDGRDVPFFRLVQDVLPPEVAFAAGVLLASYDLD
jgi:hypothetical protein